MSTEDLSPEEKEVNRLINESKTKIDELERQIKELPRDQGPAPRYNMPGGPQPHDPAKSAKAKQEALAAIEKEKNELAGKVDKTLANSSREIKDKGQKNLTSYLYPDKANDRERATEKDMAASQAFAMKLRYGGKEDGPIIPDHERAREKDLSASQDFANKLRFKEVAKQDKVSPDKTEQKKDDKTELMSMSMQFSQTLKSTQMGKTEQEPDKETHDHKAPEKGLEKEKG